MAGWTNSKIFVSFIEDALENTSALDLNTDSFKAALFNNSITPDNTAATANILFNAGQWDDANEVFDAAEWATGGIVIASTTFAPTAAVLKFDGDNTVSTGTSATLASVYGCLVYDDSVNDTGVCYNYFGGVNAVTDGTFTIVWDASGIFTLTL